MLTGFSEVQCGLQTGVDSLSARLYTKRQHNNMCMKARKSNAKLGPWNRFPHW